MKPALRMQRPLWSVVILLALIGIAVVIRRTVNLLPILINGYTPLAATSNPVAAQFAALDDVFALGKAYRHILRREIAQHREWMIRAFAIGLAVATIRPIIGLFFATSRLSGLTPDAFFGVAFWIGFVLHLILAEAWIWGTRPQTRQKLVVKI
jgi:uncharacterized membrane protein YozB (DUF420 family)